MEFLSYKQIMKMNEELQNILMNLPEGIILINEETNKVSLKNQEFMRIF
jgi:c-di-AMP phosphodiesterase-like protein